MKRIISIGFAAGGIAVASAFVGFGIVAAVTDEKPKPKSVEELPAQIPVLDESGNVVGTAEKTKLFDKSKDKPEAVEVKDKDGGVVGYAVDVKGYMTKEEYKAWKDAGGKVIEHRTVNPDGSETITVEATP